MRPLVLLLVLATLSVAEDGWRKIDVEEGVLVETRDVEGSSLHEVRATAHTKASPAEIAGVLWKQEEFPQFLDHVKRIDVLRDGATERLLYEEFSIPILKDRDIVVRARRTSDPATGALDMESIAVSDEGPPATSRCVRIHTSVSRWRLVPAPDGADVTYTIRADVGGYVPDWIANRVQHETVPVLVRKVLDRAERR
jgi:START domain